MKIKTWIKYTEGYLPSNRHRKLRYKELEEYVNITLREVELKDLTKKYSHKDRVSNEEIIYYTYDDDNLYRKATSRDVSAFEIEDPLENLKYCKLHSSNNFGFKPCDTRESMIESAYMRMAKYLLVDGELFVRDTKPMYRIYTFGCGNNHAEIGVSLSICNFSIHNANVLFEANQRKEVEKEAIEFAIR